MTGNNFEPIESTVVVEISSQTNEMVEAEMVGETDEVKHETKALIEALKRRAQAEAESAGTLTRETYLNAVCQAREAIEGEKLIERDRLEHAWAVIQEDTEKNWHLLWKEFADFGDRLQSAAKAAWEAFNAPRHH
jgi:predicted ATP-dependent endonuclease of OLD family